MFPLWSLNKQMLAGIFYLWKAELENLSYLYWYVLSWSLLLKKKQKKKQGVSTRIVLSFTEAHWEPNHLSKMKLFAKTVNG